jgi:hypothetical protein
MSQGGQLTLGEPAEVSFTGQNVILDRTRGFNPGMKINQINQFFQQRNSSTHNYSNRTKGSTFRPKENQVELEMGRI